MEVKERPPYVQWKIIPQEDRDASEAEGHYVAKDVIFAIITPQGSKDKIERNAEEWLKQIADQAKEGRFPGEWVAAFKHAFAEYKDGREVPENGTAIVNWPALSEAQKENILRANIRTVEDLAAANESTLNEIGMGARALKGKAQAWLDSSADVGKVAMELEKLRKSDEEKESSIQALTEQLKALKTEIANSKKEAA